MFDNYEEIIKVEDVADMLHIGKGRVYELLYSGQIKGFRIGRIWKIPRESVELYVRNSTGLTFPISRIK